MFTPNKARIEDILNSPAQFAIPLYQREYKWGKDEAQELIEDLTSDRDAGSENLFLGNFIFEVAKDKKTFVVDGQQRLTTIFILLIVCRQHALQLALGPLAQTTLGKITFIDSTTGESEGCRLIASDSIREIFDYIAKDTWKGDFPASIGKKQVKRQIAKLKPIYDYFLREISALDKDRLRKLLGAIYDTIVIRIDIENEVDALSIFERTNGRGIELEISDLLKNYLFSKKVEGVQDSWEQIAENSGGTILRMLKYFYVSKRGYVLKSQLYRKLKGYSAEIGVTELTKELADFSMYYRTTKAATEISTKEYFNSKSCLDISGHEPRFQKINSCLQALNEFGITQFCPPTYAAIECMIRIGGDAKSAAHAKMLIRLFDALEKYHFINNAICERIGNEVEKLYADVCLEFKTTNDFLKTSEYLIKTLRDKLATEDEFIANFVQISYSLDKLSLINYLFDRMNNHGLDPSQWIKIYNPDSKLRRRNQNIEHFLPQKPEAELKVKKETLDFINNIGNLLAISYKTNSRLSNASPAKKIERLRGDLSKEVQNLVSVNDFISKYSADALFWDKSSIEKRAQDMARDAYRQIWKIN